MREIKFRAWDEDTKKMHSVSWIDFRKDNSIRGLAVKSRETHEYLINYRHKKEQDYILMQYTGLKDKNGKEIYEGDIVSNGKEYWFVIWSENDGSWLRTNEDGVKRVTKRQVENLEVVGDIYQNKESLNEKS